MSEPEYALISLISDQPIPNIMAVLQDNRYFKYLEFIVSSVVRKDDSGNTIIEYNPTYDKLYQATKEFFESRGHIVDRLPPVDPYNLQEVMNICQLGIDKHKNLGREVILNITGGTKLMSLPAYLCGLRNHVESIYVESGRRSLITLPPPDEFNLMTGGDVLKTEEKSFDEERFREIDVPTYLALYGAEIDRYIIASDLDSKRVEQAQILAQSYPLVRERIKTLLRGIKKAFSEARNLQGESGKNVWPFRCTFDLTKITREEREILQYLAGNHIFSYEQDKQGVTLICENEAQQKFLDGKWVEVYALHSLASSGLFHDVRGNITLKGWSGECDVMLTVNAKLAIIECKSDAKLSEQFAKIRALQRDRGGLYAESFFIRTGEYDDIINDQANFYGITNVIDAQNILKINDIVAQKMGIKSRNS